jgi:4-hydroxy-tetrahydrodipicolinate reductase
MSRYKVVQWGVGYLGTIALRYLLGSRDLELVGVKCFTEEKVGRTAGELAGQGPAGVTATDDVEAILATDADCVLYMPRDALMDPSVPDSPSAVWVDELLVILASGKNVVTPLCSGTHYRHMQNGTKFHDRISEACAAGGTSVLFTGFDPGFSDFLAYTMSGAVGEINRIDTWEIVDYSTYPVHSTLQMLGFGLHPDQVPAELLEQVRHATWGGVPHLMGDGLGVEIDSISVDSEHYLAPEAFTAPGGLRVEAGTIAAIRFSVSGIAGGRPLVVVNHVTRLGTHTAPGWPSIGTDGGYRVEIDSYPPFRGDFPMGLPGGAGSTLADAMTMTSARCVNCVAAVVEAEPGYRFPHELPAFGGRHGVLPR